MGDNILRLTLHGVDYFVQEQGERQEETGLFR